MKTDFDAGAFGPAADGADFEWLPLDAVHPWEKNPRVNAKAIDAVAASIKEFGWVRPLIANRHPSMLGELIVGHTAHQAAVKLELELVPVRWRTMNARKAHAAAIADNKLNEKASWDQALLAELYTDLGADMFALAGFSSFEMDGFGITGDGPTAPAPTDNPVARLGDVWVLGAHRVACGDATDAAVVAASLGDDGKPYLLVTDPPYGVSYDPAWRTKLKGNSRGWGGQRIGAVHNDDRADWTPTWKASPAAVC